MPNNHSAPTSHTTNVADFRRVATPWVAFVAEKPNDIAGQNADPDGTIEDSVDVSDPDYDESKARTIEVQYAAEDHLEPPVYVNTIDKNTESSSEAVSPQAQSASLADQTGVTLEDEPKNSDPAEAAALVESAEIYEPKADEESTPDNESKNNTSTINEEPAADASSS